MSRSGIVDNNIFFDSDFGELTFSFPTQTSNSNESVSKTIQLRKITLWLTIMRPELGIVLNNLLQSLEKIAMIFDEQIIKTLRASENAMVRNLGENIFMLLNIFKFEGDDNVLLINGDMKALCTLFPTIINSDNTLLSSEQTLNENEICGENMVSKTGGVYVNNIKTFFKYMFTPKVIFNNKLITNPVYIKDIKTCTNLNFFLSYYGLNINNKVYSLGDITSMIYKYANDIMCSMSTLINYNYLDTLNLQPFIKELHRNALNAQIIVESQYLILYNELPALASSKYLIATMNFHNNSFINDDHVYTNNPNFVLNSSQLLIPPHARLKCGCNSLPEYLCEDIQQPKILDYHHDGFPYWTNKFRQNTKLTIDLYTQCGIPLPVTIKNEPCVSRERKTNTRFTLDNGGPLLDVGKPHLLSCTALIDVYSDIIATF